MTGSAHFTGCTSASLTSAHQSQTAVEPASLSASLSQGKTCSAPCCYFWLCFCLWDPLTFSSKKTNPQKAAALAFGLL